MNFSSRTTNMKTQIMKMTRCLWMSVIAGLLLTHPFNSRGQVQIPAAINYQGKLTDQNGNALSSGYYVVEFRIWKDPTLTGAAELAWGRSFPIHVVSGGIFNVLLTDDGSPLADGGSGPILSAFGGPERYLGLTVVQRPQGTIQDPTEIKPRQQLVSAPFTIQAQTANTVAADGVNNSSLAAGSVTTDKIASGNVTSGNLGDTAVTTAKIANGAVTEPKLANNAVSTAKIGDGQVTSAKLDINGDYHLNNHTVFLRGGSDQNNGLKWTNSFGGESLDGPALFGSSKGLLGTTSGGNKAALSWHSDGGVSLFGSDYSFPWPSNGSTRMVQANTDGFIFVYSPYDKIWFQVRRGGVSGSVVFPDSTDSPPIPNAGLLFEGSHGTDITGENILFPLRAGDVVYLHKEQSRTYGQNSVFKFIPLGISTTASAATQLQ